MKDNICDLTGDALDLAVTQIELARMATEGLYIKPWIHTHVKEKPSPYSTEWGFAGPVIEQQGIDLYHEQREPPVWIAEIQGGPKVLFKGRGNSPMVAAMRCYVTSQLVNKKVV